MSDHDGSWPAGSPCWIDLTTDDLDRSRAFYTGLFGWDFEVGPPEHGGYATATLRGRSVAGIAPRPPGTGLTGAVTGTLPGLGPWST